MNLDRALELQRRNLRGWMGLLAERSEGGALLEHDGVTGVVLPAIPERSVVNCVTYDDAERLAAALPALARAYDDAGVRAWTVWTPDFDSEAIAALEAAGHKFDGKPAAMTLDLSGFQRQQLGGLDWDDAADPGDAGRVNDLSYGFESGSFTHALGTEPVEPPARLYQARVDGEVACVLQTVDFETDCGVFFVATLPHHRGKGLARRLMSVALAEARERGCETSTLQASPMGYPVYERLGYRTACRLHMYEKRK